jgi:integrase
MASIHKDPRGKSPFWYCAYTLPNGKRTFKSTKQKDRKKALEFCLCLERASTDGKAGNLTETRAKALIGEIVERAGGAPLVFRSLKDFCEEWMESKCTKAAGTKVRYKKVIEDFLEHMGEKKAGLSIESFTARDIQSFRDNEVMKGKSEQTANLSLKTVRTLFIAAHRRGLITINPALAVDVFEAPQQKRDPFTPSQIKSLLKEASQEWTTMILLGYYLGARIGDCSLVRWSNVDFQRKEVRYMPQKTKKKQEVLITPLMPELENHLLSLPSSDKADAFLSPSLAGKPTGGNRGLSRTFKRIMEAAGILDTMEIKKNERGRQFLPLGFHSLRHSNTSELANAGVADELRQKITGHKSKAVHERYTHFNTETKRKALENLPRVLNENDEGKK